MIMAYLTDTPCIAFANSNGKLEGTYRWISDAQNVYFAKSGEEGLKEIERLMNLHNSEEFKHNEAFLQITAGCRKE
jgi:exopolysaccharide biosynthesis predicted pyruvyltransferase EpsI